MARDPRERRSVERAALQGERAPGTQGEGAPRAPPGAAQDPHNRVLAGGSPREVLARLVDGDPLGIEARCRARLAEFALLLDPERLTLRSMARVAFAAPRRDGTQAMSPWIDEQVERAAQDLIDEDRAALRSGGRVAEDEKRHAFLAEALGIEAGIALRACVVFNDLPPRVRRSFWALVVEGKSFARCVSEGLGSREEVRADARRALQALSRLENPAGSDAECRGHDD